MLTFITIFVIIFTCTLTYILGAKTFREIITAASASAILLTMLAIRLFHA